MLNVDMNGIIQIAREAGNLIMDIYQSDFGIKEKADESPLTAADEASHQWIFTELTKLYPDIPILSEEGSEIEYSQRKTWPMFWLVDPLDGTKEFIKRNGEFTVNIALIVEGLPQLGVIYAPALDALYFAEQGKGAYRQLAGGIIEPLKLKEKKTSPYVLVQSRSHSSEEGEAYLEEVKRIHGDTLLINKGSSLKFCLVAEGEADAYPRFVPTMEWDTAAGQAIVECAGGKVQTVEGQRLCYNKESLLNPFFIVST
ncbi:3'(2'),5'-bisphosphate nucleotidase CysQ [Ammoniphilus sp. YIM 78166]|uniref:3'(2'),5'-bisphosphate nucleotidase CysQ n=1 Tax=Ammoniphilus sp. YIM 78166 TaxID=1644106 RepID=UPI0010704A78|nr:3'(2'),5'-bisphosphate nucleotidase CysQ [Ammoniphilus sp. YIM 78166]